VTREAAELSARVKDRLARLKEEITVNPGVKEKLSKLWDEPR
jgi:hypothetical protein